MRRDDTAARGLTRYGHIERQRRGQATRIGRGHADAGLARIECDEFQNSPATLTLTTRVLLEVAVCRSVGRRLDP